MERTNYPSNTEAKHNLPDSGASSSSGHIVTEKYEEPHDKSMGEKMKEAISNLIPGSHKKHEEGEKEKGTGTVTSTTTATKTDEEGKTVSSTTSATK